MAPSRDPAVSDKPAHPAAPAKPRSWSREVARDSFALDLQAGVFTWDDPRAIARSLRDSAESSTRRKGTPFGSAMSMLNFYINRCGRGLPPARRATLEAAKQELRALYGRPRQGPAQPRARQPEAAAAAVARPRGTPRASR